MFFLIDAVLFLAMSFFLLLPITDHRTVRMRLCMVSALVALFAVSITRTPGVPMAPWARQLLTTAQPAPTVPSAGAAVHLQEPTLPANILI